MGTKPGRHADIYVFAWHPETKARRVDHRALEQWTFFVIATENLESTEQRTIGIAYLDKRVQCGTARKTTANSLADTIEAVRSTLSGPPRLPPLNG